MPESVSRVSSSVGAVSRVSSVLSRSPVGGRARSRSPLCEIQRARVLAGSVAAVDELGYEGATVGKLTAHARVSRRTFYELFPNRDECLAAVLEAAVARVGRELEEAGVGDLPWRERVRAGLLVILGFMDREPALARVCMVHALRAGAPVREVRERVLAELVGVVHEGRLQGARGEACGELTAEGLVGAALAIVHARIAHPGPASPEERPESVGLVGLVGELMGMIVLPYLGPAAARRERERELRSLRATNTPRHEESPHEEESPVAVHSRGAEDPLQGVPMRLTYRTARVLDGIREFSKMDAQPSNRQVATFAGISDPGQISKLLSRLQRLGLIETRGGGHAQGAPNQWCLTEKGALVAAELYAHAPSRREAA